MQGNWSLFYCYDESCIPETLSLGYDSHTGTLKFTKIKGLSLDGYAIPRYSFICKQFAQNKYSKQVSGKKVKNGLLKRRNVLANIVVQQKKN